MENLKHLFDINKKAWVWLQREDGCIIFPSNGFFRHLIPSQAYTLETRTRDLESEVIDLTTSSPPAKLETPLQAGAQPSPSSSQPTGIGEHHCYICIAPPLHPIKCLNCDNVIGCLKCVLNMSEHDKRCPLCKKESIILACAASL